MSQVLAARRTIFNEERTGFPQRARRFPFQLHIPLGVIPMKFQQKKVAAAVACALGGAAMIAGAPVLAQDVVRYVTGSNIKRTDVETAAPIQTITREDIQETGLQTISEVVRQITANNNGSISDSFTNGFSAGGSGVSLRGLGPNNTLVLVNGRRMATYGLADDGHASYVDLQQIPFEAVERIEVLKDGASAIYGSDAVAGVVNIILRQTFTGVSVDGLVGTNYKGKGTDYKASIVGGMGDLTKDRYNVYATFDYQKIEALPANSLRSYMGSNNLTGMGLGDQRPGSGMLPGQGVAGGTGTLSGVVRPVNPTTGGSPGAFQPLLPLNCAPSQVDANGYCRFEIKDYVDHQPEVERFNVFARGSYQFSDTMQGYSELSYFDVKTHTRTTPAAFRSTWPNVAGSTVRSTQTNWLGLGQPIFLPVGHPDNPFNAQNLGARIYYTTGEIGGRDSDIETNTQRYLVGLKGTNYDWDWDVAALYIKTKTDYTRTGFLLYDRLVQAINGTGPYGYYRLGANASLNNPAIYQWLAPDAAWSPTSSNTFIDAKASRDLMKLEGGQLGLAVGTQWWQEKLNNPGTPGTYDGNVVGLGYSAANGSRDIWALFAELYAPVLKNLELTAAIRMDDYSDVGTTWNPKVSAKWTIVPQLVARASWATGFRAPGLYENGDSASAGFTTASDPVRCPVTGSPLDCAATVVDINTGNPLIKPERSTSWTAGFVFEPVSGLSGTLDYWNIEVKDQISIGSVQGVLNDPANFPNAQIVRATDNLPGIPNSGTLLAVQAPYTNANTVKTDGIDFDIKYRWDMKEYGRLTPEFQWTHVFNYKQTLGGVTYQYVGTQGNYDVSSGSATPQDRMNLIIGWDQGPWNVTGTVRYVSDYQSIAYEGAYADSGCLSSLDTEPDCHVSSFTTLDLSASYKGFKNWEIYGSVINVFNRMAPFNPAAAYGNVNYNYNYAASGATGTVFNLGAKYTFK
jgi:iron complex outermembrane receptor protein